MRGLFYLARPLSVVLGEPGILVGNAVHMGTVVFRFRNKVPAARY